MDYIEQHRQKAIAHYIELYLNPAWEKYAWRQVQAMAKENPAMYGDLPEKLNEAMQKKLSEERRLAGG